MSGSLYEDPNDALRLEFPEDSDDEASNVLMFLLSTAGGLQVSQIRPTRTPYLGLDTHMVADISTPKLAKTYICGRRA